MSVYGLNPLFASQRRVAEKKYFFGMLPFHMLTYFFAIIISDLLIVNILPVIIVYALKEQGKCMKMKAICLD